MYSYIWDKKTNGYLLTTETGKYVANEIRPVFVEELELTGLAERFTFDHKEMRPMMWAIKNAYFYRGEKILQFDGTQYGRPLNPIFFFEGIRKLVPVDVEEMIRKNAAIMDLHVADTKRRTKELYEKDIKRCDTAYIAFSGGKDSIALLDLCDKVLPNNVPVIFSDTDMELPDTYKVWQQVQKKYLNREFIMVRADNSAIENWRLFGPPSRTVRWCCSVHKSSPALVCLKKRFKKEKVLVMAFTGVRQEESNSRADYADSSDGMKATMQINRMPIVEWGAHELWLYIFANNLIINAAYRKGLARVGCIMCPESSHKYEWFVDKAYPGLLQPYNEIIIETSAKTFSSKDEQIAFIGGLSWQARKSGSVLNSTITNPIENIDGLKASFKSHHLSEELFYEWIKVLGDVEKTSDGAVLRLPKTLDDEIPFKYTVLLRGGEVNFTFKDVEQKNAMLPPIRTLLKKASSCIGCRSCEVECVFGAIKTENGMVTIDAAKCKKCKKCYNLDSACWRFKSMYKSENEKTSISGINRYNNFGLREAWVSTLIELGDDYFPWHDEHPQGKKMVESASAWFQQAGLVKDKSRKITSLTELFRLRGISCIIGWDFIWMSLANNAAIVKWLISTTHTGQINEIEQLSNALAASYPTLGKSTIDGGLSAFKDMITKSPIGGSRGVVDFESKGKSVISVVRNAKEVSSLVVLFGLYLIAQKSERSSFTIRELLSADENSDCISPIVAFGIPADKFKLQCQGLATRFPELISCTFTHGLDEIKLFPQNYAADYIINIALGE